MRMTTDEIANVNSLGGVVAERQANAQIANVLCFDDIQIFHIAPPYSFLLILVLRTLCFKTKDFTNLLMMFL